MPRFSVQKPGWAGWAGHKPAGWLAGRSASWRASQGGQPANWLAG